MSYPSLPSKSWVFPKDNYGGSDDRAKLSSDNKPFNNCDVCYTCRIFNINNFKCEYYNAFGFVTNRQFDETYYHEDYSVSIINPEWWRCMWWVER
jgi:hypothetical protein